MTEERITSDLPAASGSFLPQGKERLWIPIGVVGFIVFLVVLVRSLGSQGPPAKAPDNHSTSSRPTARLDYQSGQPRRALPVSTSQSKQATKDGLSYETPGLRPTLKDYYERKVPLSYETVIPRPTKKGYYEPRVVPYPEGKPVYVNGYYRRDGTYVRPHYRSLPRR